MWSDMKKGCDVRDDSVKAMAAGSIQGCRQIMRFSNLGSISSVDIGIMNWVREVPSFRRLFGVLVLLKTAISLEPTGIPVSDTIKP